MSAIREYVLVYASTHAAMRVAEMHALCDMMQLSIAFDPEQMHKVWRN